MVLYLKILWVRTLGRPQTDSSLLCDMQLVASLVWESKTTSLAHLVPWWSDWQAGSPGPLTFSVFPGPLHVSPPAGWLGFIHTGSGLQESEREVADHRKGWVQKWHSCDQLLCRGHSRHRPARFRSQRTCSHLSSATGVTWDVGGSPGAQVSNSLLPVSASCPGKSQPHFIDEETEA